MPHFGYEKDFANRWQPVVHFEKPSRSVNGSDRERTTLFDVPVELLGQDGVSPQFGKLQTLFPAPKEAEL